MPLSTDVNLPRKHKARFPNRCVRCGQDPADGKIKLWTHTIGWLTFFFWFIGRGFTTSIPACNDCRWKIRAHRVGGLALTIVVAILFMVFIWPQLDEFVARPLRKWAAMGMLLVTLAPYFVWEIFFPPSIDITAFSDSVDYEFRDSGYAEEFAELNVDAEWVKLE